MDLTGHSTRQTGDINLAAALMACAIPLDRDDPVRLIESASTQSPYASFRLAASSADGVHSTDACNGHWSGREPLPEHHPFAVVCRFIRARPAKRMSVSEWLDHAVDYLSDMGVSLPGLRTYDDIPDFIRALPTAPESYVLAFVYNRRTCLDLFRDAARAVHQSRGNAHSLIDHRLSKPLRNELLSRLQG